MYGDSFRLSSRPWNSTINRLTKIYSHFMRWLFSLNQNLSFLPDSEWLDSPDVNKKEDIDNLFANQRTT